MISSWFGLRKAVLRGFRISVTFRIYLLNWIFLLAQCPIHTNPVHRNPSVSNTMQTLCIEILSEGLQIDEATPRSKVQDDFLYVPILRMLDKWCCSMIMSRRIVCDFSYFGYLSY